MGILNHENVIVQKLPHEPFSPDDYLLKYLISLVEEESAVLSITLNVKGIIISGNLITKEQYYKVFLTELVKEIQSTKEVTNCERNYLSRMIDGSRITDGDNYIYLERVQFHYSSMDSSTLEKAVLWRGKLLSVDGFALGSVTSYP